MRGACTPIPLSIESASIRMQERSCQTNPGMLHVVATPIGNLADITHRAVDVLERVDLIAAEDTRRTRQLLAHLGIRKRLISFHDQNEDQRSEQILSRLQAGHSVALVSDAGTPLISDPGFRLIREARRRGLPVTPVPGACSIIAALSVAGLPTDRFVFEGFLPPRATSRRRYLLGQRFEPRTLVFLESSHRIVACLQDLADSFGSARIAALARELTKRYETIRLDTLGGLIEWVAEHPERQRGEFVIVVAGATVVQEEQTKFGLTPKEVLDVLLEELPLKQSVRLAARLTGASRNVLYRLAVEGRS